MWVICGGMKRSGSTLQFQIAARIVEEAGRGKRVEWSKAQDFPQLRRKYVDYSGTKVYKTHTLTDEIKKEFAQGNAIALYIYRDLRDVFVSSMTKERADFAATWKSGLLDQCIASFNAWTALPGVLVSRYEDVVADLGGEASRIAEKIGIPLPAKDAARIAEDYTLQRQKERMRQVKEEGKAFDEKELLHGNHISSGKPGQWQERLRTVQVVRIEQKVGRWLREQGYGLSAAGKVLAWRAR